MGIREVLTTLPTAGSIAVVSDVPGVGSVHVRRISAKEFLAISSEKASSHVAAMSLVDEKGVPLFASEEEFLERCTPAVYGALVRASNSVNFGDLAAAEKKIEDSPMVDFVMAIAFAFKKSMAEIGEWSLAEITYWHAWLKNNDREQRDDWRFGQLCSVVANCHSHEGGWKARDFMLMPPPEPELGTESDFIVAVQNYAAARGNLKGNK